MPGVLSRPPRVGRGKAARFSQQSNASITSFARVSKAVPIEIGTTKSAAIIEITVAPARKRKALDDAEESTINSKQPSPALAIKRARRAEPVTTPTKLVPSISRSGKRKAVDTPEIEDHTSISTHTPSSKRQRQQAQLDSAAQAGALLERLNLQSSDSKPQLPQELLDLIDLYAAFLKTVTVQHAHNGTNAPIDLRTICPLIAQSWGKRKITTEDIRRCIGLVKNPFILSDYGRGKICIELDEASHVGLLKEDQLRVEFEAQLRKLWSARKNDDATAFTNSLPLAAITVCASAIKAAPLLEKGQRALEDLRAGIAQRQQEKDAKAAAATAAAALNPDGTKMGLLDRIRFKQLQLATHGSQAPSPEELRRRAALQRAGDVAACLGMLSAAAGQARVAFSMQAVLVRLRDSLRVPIATEDGTCCVKLLASEIAPQWLRIITVGGRENVVVQVAFQPSKAAVEQKVAELMA